MKIVWSLFDGSGIMGLPWAIHDIRFIVLMLMVLIMVHMINFMRDTSTKDFIM